MEDGHGHVMADGSWEARACTGFSDEIFSSENMAVGSEEGHRPAHALGRMNVPGTSSRTRGPPPRLPAAVRPGLGGRAGPSAPGEDGRTRSAQPAEPERPADATCALYPALSGPRRLPRNPSLAPRGRAWGGLALK